MLSEFGKFNALQQISPAFVYGHINWPPTLTEPGPTPLPRPPAPSTRPTLRPVLPSRSDAEQQTDRMRIIFKDVGLTSFKLHSFKNLDQEKMLCEKNPGLLNCFAVLCRILRRFDRSVIHNKLEAINLILI